MAQTLGSVAVGSIVKLKENGAAVNYIVVHQGRPSSSYDTSCDGTWLLRQDIAENRVWDSGNSNVLESSDIQSYLNNTWINRYDSDIRSAIKQVKIPYRQNGGSGGTDRSGSNGLSCKIFLLSGKEVGWDSSDNPYFPNDGAKLAYFESGNGSSAQQKRIAKLNGGVASWWLRSPNTVGTDGVWNVSSNGNYGNQNAGTSFGVRPALVLPSTLFVTDDGLVSVTVPPPAVVISGTDGGLGTLVNDVSYTVSSDGSTELTVVETINGTETRTYTATNGATNKIPVVDLPTGYGTIKITASTNRGSGVVTVTREWTYTKAAITFPDAGGVADLTQQGKTIWAKTIAEAVRTPGIWGGNLGLALQKLANAVLYDPETGGFNGIGGADATIPMVSIETGSYVGTGTFGQDNPNTLTLPFKPDILIIQKRYQEPSANTNLSFAIISAESGFATNQFLNGHNPSGFLTLWVTSTENSISWYAGPSAGAQQNAQNIPYYYTAIGKAGGAT